MSNLVIVKLGGSAITDKNAVKRARIPVIKRVAKEINEALAGKNFNLIIVLGGGSFGHPIAKKYEIHRGIASENSLIGVSETVDSMRELSLIVTQIFRDQGLPVIPIQPSAIAINNNTKLETMYSETMKKYIEIGMIPVLWGDVALDNSLGVSILSGDNIISHLAIKYGAAKVVFGMEIDGFYYDPINQKGLIREICEDNIREILNYARDSSAIDVTGGMARKIEEILPMYEREIEIFLVNITKPGVLRDVLLGKRVIGTIIRKKCGQT